MRLLQLLGLRCRHRYLSYPISGRRVCSECGAEFPVDYAVETWERGDVQHYKLQVSSIKRLQQSVLRFRQKQQQ